MLGIPEQALALVCGVLECVLAHGALMDKAKALLLMARCQVALSVSASGEHRLTGVCVCVHFASINCIKLTVMLLLSRYMHLYGWIY